MFLLCLFRRCALRYVHGNDQRDSRDPILTLDRWGIELFVRTVYSLGNYGKQTLCDQTPF